MNVLSTMDRIPCSFAIFATAARSVTVSSGLAGLSTRMALTSGVMLFSSSARSEVSTIS